MLLGCALRAIALVAVVAAEGAKYDPLSELDAFPEFRRGLLKYRQHRRGHHVHVRPRRGHKMALTHHYGVVHPQRPSSSWSPADAEVAPAAVKPATEPMTLPGRHKSVEKALEGMSGDLVALKEKQLAAKDARGQLEGKVREATHHMNDAVSIKHAIAQKEAEMRKEQMKLRGLERESKHIEQTHTSLVSSLHRVLEPKLLFARERLGKKEMVLDKEQQAATSWQHKRDQLHDNALERLKDKKLAHASLFEAEQRVAQAKKEETVARINYEHKRQLTGQEIQSFRYSETRLKAEVTHEKAAEEATLAAKESVSKLNNVLQVESEKVEESMEVNRNRIRRKMGEIAASQEKSRIDLENLRHQYTDWQEKQRVRAADVIRKGQETAATADAYTEGQKQVLDSAQTKVARDAESKSDWAGESWQSGFESDAGFTDETPSFDN